MVKVERLTQSDTKRINRNRIFRYIYSQKALSRQDIADGLDLSLPTVNQNIKELFDNGLVDYAGNFQSTGGRKAQAIMVPQDVRYAISINIRTKYIRASLVNIYGDICVTREYEELFSTSEKYRKLLGTIANEIADYAECPREYILGVGITVPGVIDKENGLIVSAPTIKIKNYPLEMIKEFIDFPCTVENDAKAFAYAQMWKNDDYDKKICLLVDRGVGGSMMTGNDVFVSNLNRTGEFGHMIIHPNGKLCACGRKGCLEAYVSTTVISEELGIHIWEFFERVKQEKKFKSILNEYLDNLALGINNISTIYDAPVIIGGEIAKYIEPYMDQMIEKVKKYDNGFMDNLYVSLSEYGKQENMIGAALMYIEEFLVNV